MLPRRDDAVQPRAAACLLLSLLLATAPWSDAHVNDWHPNDFEYVTSITDFGEVMSCPTNTVIFIGWYMHFAPQFDESTSCETSSKTARSLCQPGATDCDTTIGFNCGGDDEVYGHMLCAPPEYLDADINYDVAKVSGTLTCDVGTSILWSLNMQYSAGSGNNDANSPGCMRDKRTPCDSGETSCTASVCDTTGNDEGLHGLVCTSNQEGKQALTNVNDWASITGVSATCPDGMWALWGFSWYYTTSHTSGDGGCMRDRTERNCVGTNLTVPEWGSTTIENPAYACSSAACDRGGTNAHTLNMMCVCLPGFALQNATEGCLPCPLGTQPDENRTLCVPCEAGTYCSRPDRAALQCGNATVYCPEGSDQPLAVGVGNYSTGGANETMTAQVVCEEGYGCREGVRTACVAGWYAPAGSVGCLECPGGSWSGPTSGDCYTCPPGSYSAPGSSQCYNCSAGTSSGTGASVCTNCTTGEWSVEGGLCETCPAGTYSPVASTQCFDCAAGTYAASNKSDTCVTCGAVPACMACDPTTGIVALRQTCTTNCTHEVHGECWECDGDAFTVNNCYIDSTCYDDGDFPDPASDAHYTCKMCDASNSTSVWTGLPGLPCDDGDDCTHSDTCSGEVCSGTPYGSSCLDVAYTGEASQNCEVCDGLGACVMSPSWDGSIVDVTPTQRACGCRIGGSSYVHGAINPFNECQQCDVTVSRTRWQSLTGQTCDDGNDCSHSDVCTSSGVCRGTSYRCVADVCHVSATCTGLAPPSECDAPLWAAEEDRQCRAAVSSTCQARAACTGSAASCPAVTFDQANLVTPEAVNPLLVAPSGVLSSLPDPAQRYWPDADSLRVAWTPPTVECGNVDTTWYLKTLGDTEVAPPCSIAGAVTVTSAINVELSSDTTQVVDLSGFGSLSQGGRYLIVVAASSSIQPGTFTDLVCLNGTIVIDTSAPEGDSQSVPQNVDPDTGTAGVRFHHATTLTVQWDPFTDAESSWQQPGSMAYQVSVVDAATPWVDVYTSPWGFYNGEFSTPESLQLLTATPYLVKVRAGNAADLVSDYQTSPSIVIDHTPPPSVALFDGPPVVDSVTGAVQALDVAAGTGTCVQVHWTPHLSDTIGPATSARNIETITFAVGSAPGSDNIMPAVSIDGANVEEASSLIGTWSACDGGVARLADDGVIVYTTVTATNFAGLEVALSTDGFVYDTSPPEVEYVWDTLVTNPTEDAVFRGDSDAVTAAWAIADPHQPANVSLVYHWRVLVNDAAVATGVTSNSSIRVDSVALVDLDVVSVEVTAVNAAGINTTGTSDGATVTITHPTFGNVSIVDPQRPQFGGPVTALGTPHVAATAAACDSNVGVDGVYWRVLDMTAGNGTVGDGVIVWQDTPGSGGSGATFDAMLPPLVHGHTHRVMADCISAGGLVTSAYADFLYDATPPAFLGNATTGATAGTNVHYVADATRATVHWNASDPDSGIDRVVVALHVCDAEGQPSGATVIASTDVASSGSVTLTASPALQHSLEYCWKVTAFSNAHPLNTSVGTAPFVVDVTPPQPGTLVAAFVDSSAGITINWAGFVDAESGIASFTWYAGSSLGTDEVVSATTLPSSATGDAATLSQLAAHRTHVYVTLVATNAGGASTTTSVMLTSDRVAPDGARVQVHDAWLGRGADGVVEQPAFHVEPCCLQSWWEGVADNGTGIAAFRVAVGTIVDPDAVHASTAVRGRATYHDTETVGSAAALVDGETYVTTVTLEDFGGGTSVVESAGVTVDMSAPVNSSISLRGETDAEACVTLGGILTCSDVRALRSSWAAFTDAQSGVVSHTLALGPQPLSHAGGIVSGAGSAPAMDTYTIADVVDGGGELDGRAVPPIAPGQVYYATVVGVSGSGRAAVSVSSPFRFDDSAPLRGTVALMAVATQSQPSPLSLRRGAQQHTPDHEGGVVVTPGVAPSVALLCTWGGFEEPHSGLGNVTVSLLPLLANGKPSATPAAQAVIVPPVAVGAYTFDVSTSVLPAGRGYTCSVTATNILGGATTATAAGPVVVETTAPVAGAVFDGTEYLLDADTQVANGTLAASWEAFVDPESGIEGYEAAVGSTPGSDDVVAWGSVGQASSWNVVLPPGSALAEGVPVYVSVRATNGAGMATTASSDGISVSTRAPEVELSLDWLVLPAVHAPDRTTCGCTTPGAHFSDIANACLCDEGLAFNATTKSCVAAGTGASVPPTADAGVQDNEARRLVYTEGPVGVRGDASSYGVVLAAPCGGDESHLVLNDGTCVCPAGQYRLATVTAQGNPAPCSLCPPQTYKRQPGDSPALCVPCWFRDSDTLQAGVQASWSPTAASQGAAPPIATASWGVGSTATGAQWLRGNAVAAGANTAGDVDLDTFRAFGGVPFRHGAAAYAHIHATGDNGVAAAPVVAAVTTPLDAIPPSAGWVSADSPVPGNAGAAMRGVQASNSTLWATWSGFNDPESAASGLASIDVDGIAAYDVAFGTLPHQDDVVSFYRVSTAPGAAEGATHNVSVTGLALAHGVAYYVTVRAWNAAGAYTQAASLAVRVDVTPPIAPTIAVVSTSEAAVAATLAHEPWLSSGTGFTVAWSPLSDPESGIVLAEWAVGVAGDAASILSFTPLDTTVSWVAGDAHGVVLPPSQSADYVVSLRLTNGIGRVTVATSPLFGVDVATPSNVTVWVQPVGQAYVQAATTLEVAWSYDAGASGVAAECQLTVGGVVEGAQAVVGTVEDSDGDVVTMTVTCAAGAASVPATTMRHGVTYYAALELASGAGLAVVASAPAVTIDRTPPISPSGTVTLADMAPQSMDGVVYVDGTGSVATTDGLPVSWPGFAEDVSGVVVYAVTLASTDSPPVVVVDSAVCTDCVYIAATSNETVPAQRHVFNTTVAALLQRGQAYTMSVEAENGAGGVSSVSSGMLVLDDTAPNVTGVRAVSASDTSQHVLFQADATTVRAAWSVVDAESLVATVEWSIESSDDGPTHFALSPTVLADGAQCGEATGLSLLHGRAYVVRVRARNVVGQWSAYVESPPFLVDTSAATPGRLSLGGTIRHHSLAITPAASAAADGTACGCATEFAIVGADGSTCMCPAGRFFGASGECEMCPPGTFKAAPGDDMADCVACGAGGVVLPAGDACVCNSAQSLVALGMPAVCTCAAGYTASAGGHVTDYNATTGATTTVSLAGGGAGLHGANATTAASCAACPTGTAKAWAGHGPCLGCPQDAMPASAGGTCACTDPNAEYMAPESAPVAVLGGSELGVCLCRAGFEWNSLIGACIACAPGSFKNTVSNAQMCRSCPLRTQSTSDGTSCTGCVGGTSFDADSAACITSSLPWCPIRSEVCTDEAATSVLESGAVDSRIVVTTDSDTEIQTTCMRCAACDAPPFTGAGLPVTIRLAGFVDGESGLMDAAFRVALGTTPWGQQASSYVDVPASAVRQTAAGYATGNVTLDVSAVSAALGHRSPLYASATYTNGAGVSGSTTQLVAQLDATPPAPAAYFDIPAGLLETEADGASQLWRVGLDAAEAVAPSLLEVVLRGVTDPESGVARVAWFLTDDPQAALPTAAASVSVDGEADVSLTLRAQDVPAAFTSGGVWHYVVAVVVNRAGLSSRHVSDAIEVDTSVPLAGTVLDGQRADENLDCVAVSVPTPQSGSAWGSGATFSVPTPAVATGSDAPTTSTDHPLGVTWSPFASADVPIVRYEWAVGTACGMDDVLPFAAVDATATVPSSVVRGRQFYTAVANATTLLTWAQARMQGLAPMSSGARAAYKAAEALSLQLVATVRGVNQFGASTEHCSDGWRLLVAECDVAGEAAAAGFMCAALRDVECRALAAGV